MAIYEDKKIQLGVRIPELLVRALDKYVDGSTYRSRAHLVSEMIVEWIARQHLPEIPIPPFSCSDIGLVTQAIKRKQAAREFFRLANGDPLKDAERETILTDIQTVPEEKIRQRNNLAFLFETLKRLEDEASGKPTLETQVTEIHFALQMQIDELKKEIKTLKGGQPDSQENTQAKKK
jgi:hypothetical protein